MECANSVTAGSDAAMASLALLSDDESGDSTGQEEDESNGGETKFMSLVKPTGKIRKNLPSLPNSWRLGAMQY